MPAGTGGFHLAQHDHGSLFAVFNLLDGKRRREGEFGSLEGVYLQRRKEVGPVVLRTDSQAILLFVIRQQPDLPVRVGVPDPFGIHGDRHFV